MHSYEDRIRAVKLYIKHKREHAAEERFLAGFGASSIPQACGRGYEPRVCHLAKTPAISPSRRS